MRTKKFFDLNHARAYLQHTIIRVAGQPVYVMDVSQPRGDDLLLHYSLANNAGGRVKAVKVNHESVDMNPVPLGMTRYFNGVTWYTFYISRYPARRWKIGLSRDNIGVTDPTGEELQRDYVQDLLPSPTLAETIMRKYLSLNEAKDELRKAKGCLPISWRFCFDHTGNLYYKMLCVPVGKVETNAVTLKDEFMYLREVMQEDIRC